MAGAVVEARILSDFPEWQQRLTLPVLALVTLTAMILSDLRHTRLPNLPVWSALAAAIGVLVLFAPPTAWAAIAVWNGPNASLPSAGPDLIPTGAWFPRSGPNAALVLAPNPPSGQLPDLSRLVSYLQAHREGGPFLGATLYATTAAQIVVATGEPVMTLGGFSGIDHVLSPDQLTEHVERDRVRFFYLPSALGFRPDLQTWTAGRCRVLPAAEWGAGAGRPTAGGPMAPHLLLDCGHAPKLPN